jgi:hypothetical protein
MDLDAVRDAAFCHRHREITRSRGKEIARERLEQARRDRAEWVVLFDDVTPLGSHRLEMHVRSGRGLHASCKRDIDRPATYSLEVVQLDPGTGTWLLDEPPLMPAQTYRTPDEWEARIAQARATFGGLTMNVTHPQRIIDAHCHRRDPAVEVLRPQHPVKPTVYD